jgi:hypothetical protein
VVFDSRVAYAGVCVGLHDVPANTAATYTYPDYAGYTAIVLTATGSRAWGHTIDYALGYPRVTVDATAERTLMVFMQ